MTRPCPCSHHLAARLLNQATAWMPARPAFPAAGWTPAMRNSAVPAAPGLPAGPADGVPAPVAAELVSALAAVALAAAGGAPVTCPYLKGEPDAH
jgi:hypothetical protein